MRNTLELLLQPLLRSVALRLLAVQSSPDRGHVSSLLTNFGITDVVTGVDVIVNDICCPEHLPC